MEEINKTEYLLIKRLKKLCHCGEVNLPFGTPAFVKDNFICVQKEDKILQICFEHSETAFTYFAYNLDGRGEERKDIIKDCIEIMSHIDKMAAFGSLLYDPVFMKYKKNPLDKDEWSWDRDKVHKAPIDDLKYMRTIFKGMPKLIGGVPNNDPIIDLRFIKIKGLKI